MLRSRQGLLGRGPARPRADELFRAELGCAALGASGTQRNVKCVFGWEAARMFDERLVQGALELGQGARRHAQSQRTDVELEHTATAAIHGCKRALGPSGFSGSRLAPGDARQAVWIS